MSPVTKGSENPRRLVAASRLTHPVNQHEIRVVIARPDSLQLIAVFEKEQVSPRQAV
jgi:hypothetical protein